MSRLGVYTYLKRHIGFVRGESLASKSRDYYSRIFLMYITIYNYTECEMNAYKLNSEEYLFITYDWGLDLITVRHADMYYQESEHILALHTKKYKILVQNNLQRLARLEYSGFCIEKWYDQAYSLRECITMMYNDVKALAIHEL